MSILEIGKILTERGERLLAEPRCQIKFTGDRDADELLNNLQDYPHAFVVACVMDRQIKAEKAWLIPHRLRQRLGTFNLSDLATLSLQAVTTLMCQPEPLHRFPDVMSKNFFSTVRRIAEQYSGDASLIWKENPSSATVVRRFLEFDGVGPKIATMAANILVRGFKIPVSDRISIDISPDVQVRRVLTRLGLIDKDSSNEYLIYRARELCPTYPGVFDLVAWEIGRNWCRPRKPSCSACYMDSLCPKKDI